MRWRNARQSSNIEDRRGRGGGGVALGTGGTLVLALIVFALGGDPTQLIVQSIQQSQIQEVDVNTPEAKEQLEFVSSVVGTTEDVWTSLYDGYQYPTLVAYTGMTSTGCGTGQAAMGPFYCPLDQKIYIDLGFFEELEKRLGAGGDFARAYVIAHEVGHHVQTLSGTSQKVRSLQARAGKKEANKLSVGLELQADCYAGIWAYHVQSQLGLLEEGDIDEALKAASAVGDDTLAQNAGRAVVPDSFSHGSSAQRKEWFYRGYKSGDVKDCTTIEGI